MTKRDQEQHHRFQYGAVTYRYNIDRNFVEVDHDHSEPAYDENDFCRHYNALESVKAHSTSTISSRFSLRRIQICPARACNLKCRYCYASHTIDYSAPAIMDAAVGRRCIDFVLSKAGSRRDIVVAFVGGGEPLIGWPTIRKIVQYCRYIEQNSQRRFYFQINTNATLMNEAIRAFLVANEFRVIVSIDGFEAMHDAMRVYPDGSGSYADTVANTLALKAEFD